jgi:hypothetical protein
VRAHLLLQTLLHFLEPAATNYESLWKVQITAPERKHANSTLPQLTGTATKLLPPGAAPFATTTQQHSIAVCTEMNTPFACKYLATRIQNAAPAQSATYCSKQDVLSSCYGLARCLQLARGKATHQSRIQVDCPHSLRWFVGT